MSTSANTTYFMIFKDGKFVGELSQNCLCKNTIKERLTSKYQPPEDYAVQLRYPDEDEIDRYTNTILLKSYLDGEKPVWEDSPDFYDEDDVLDEYDGE